MITPFKKTYIQIYYLPFSETFITSFVAKSLNRKFIRIEMNEDFIKINICRVLNQTELNGEYLITKPKTCQIKNTQKQTLFEAEI